ncbi:UNVERIFIED_CONTAM: UDP-glycosyltransferase-02a, partial [Ephemera danica]
ATKLSEYIQHFTLDWDLAGHRFRGQMPISLPKTMEYAVESCRLLLRDPDTRRFLKGRSYQLVMLDGAYSACALGLAYHFSAPYMFLNTVAMYTEPLAIAGNPEVFAITPFVNTAYTEHMGMLARLHNAVLHLMSRILQRFVVNFFVQPELRATFGT